MINSAALMVDHEAGVADRRYGGADGDDNDMEPEIVSLSPLSPLRAPLLGAFDKGGDIESVQEAEVQQVSGCCLWMDGPPPPLFFSLGRTAQLICR